MPADIDTVMRSLSGIAHLQDLLSAGFTRHEVARFHRTGVIVRPRIGWYVAPWHSSDVVRAVRVGGVLGCVSAAKSFGCSVPPDDRVHVALPGNAARLRSSTDGFVNVAASTDTTVVRHWSIDRPAERFRTALLPALAHVLSCVDAEWAISVVDSARTSSAGRPPLISDRDLHVLAGSVGPDKRRLLELSSPRAESVLESIVRVRLGKAGYAVHEQVEVGRYRADLLVAGRIAVECDGFEHHGTRDRFEYDRRRDAAFAAAGYQTLRVSYRRVMGDWDGILRELASMTSRTLSPIR